MSKTITNENNDGHLHGYQQWYLHDKLWYRGNFKNGVVFGYYEKHLTIVFSSESKYANYYIT